jgi:hypothetical protein
MNHNYYNLTRQETTEVASLARKYTTIPSIVTSVIGGYIFDIYGRKFTAYYLLLLSALLICLNPKVAPNLTAYVWIQNLYSLLMSPISNLPLINDCVCKSSLGAVSSF